MKKTKASRKHKKNVCISLFCWGIVPFILVALLILDAMGIYPFNTERLIVIGVCVIVMLFPFFSEITIKNVSIKKDKKIK